MPFLHQRTWNGAARTERAAVAGWRFMLFAAALQSQKNRPAIVGYALEVIRDIVGFGTGLVGKLLILDALDALRDAALSMESRKSSVRKEPDDPRTIGARALILYRLSTCDRLRSWDDYDVRF